VRDPRDKTGSSSSVPPAGAGWNTTMSAMYLFALNSPPKESVQWGALDCWVCSDVRHMDLVRALWRAPGARLEESKEPLSDLECEALNLVVLAFISHMPQIRPKLDACIDEGPAAARSFLIFNLCNRFPPDVLPLLARGVRDPVQEMREARRQFSSALREVFGDEPPSEKVEAWFDARAEAFNAQARSYLQ
jgi:hypothetical protein